MKIKLVTFAPHPNFGTCLQSYALNKVLRRMGHDVEFIYNGREDRHHTFKGRIKSLIKHFVPKSIIDKRKAKKQNVPANTEPYIITLPSNHFHYWLSKLPFYKALYKKYKCRNLQWKNVYKFAFEDDNYNMKRLFIKKQFNIALITYKFPEVVPKPWFVRDSRDKKSWKQIVKKPSVEFVAKLIEV